MFPMLYRVCCGRVCCRRVCCGRGLSTDHGNIQPVGTKNLFVDTKLSERYAKHRPKLPTQHVQSLVDMLGKRPGTIIDVGCGPGVSTQQFVGYSDKVIGVDVSETQIAVARQNITDPSVSFILGTCEKLNVEPSSAEIVAVVQAAHYFDLPPFFKEVDRVLKPGGILGLSCFPMPTFTDTTGSLELDLAFNHIFNIILAPYMSPVVQKILQTRYAPITLPYSPRSEFIHVIRTEVSYQDVLDLIGTFSYFALLRKEKDLSYDEGVELIDEVMSRKGVGESTKKRKHCMNYTAFMIAAQKPAS